MAESKKSKTASHSAISSTSLVASSTASAAKGGGSKSKSASIGKRKDKERHKRPSAAYHDTKPHQRRRLCSPEAYAYYNCYRCPYEERLIAYCEEMLREEREQRVAEGYISESPTEIYMALERCMEEEYKQEEERYTEQCLEAWIASGGD